MPSGPEEVVSRLRQWLRSQAPCCKKKVIRHLDGQEMFGRHLHRRNREHVHTGSTEMERTEGMEMARGGGALSLWKTLFKTHLGYRESSVMKGLSLPIKNIVITRDRYSNSGCDKYH